MRTTRRRFLAGAACSAAAAPFVQTSMAWAAPQTAADHTVVVLFLRGGMDGLSAVVPIVDGRYYDRRPTIAVPAEQTLPLSATFGLHPALSGLHTSWLAGNLAIIPAVGSDFDSRSHFDQQDHIERGGRHTHNGWLTRHLHSRPKGPADALEAIAVSGNVPASLSGPSNTIASRRISSLELDGWWGATKPLARTGLEAMYEEAAHTLLRDAAPTTFAALDRIAEADPDAVPATVEYPDTRLAAGMLEIARLVKAGVAPDVATIDMGGWDTHDEMGLWSAGRMVDNLRELGDALGAFTDDLGAAMDRVTVVVQSEFGRRAFENGSNGCDHGRGGAMFVLGNRINGGVHGDWPTLADHALDRGDVAVANDYRDVLGEVVVDLLGNERVDDVFPGHTVRPMGIVT